MHWRCEAYYSPGPPFGVDRCGATLLALVRAEYRQELHELSAALGLADGAPHPPFSID